MFFEAVQERRYLGKPLRYESGQEGERISGEFGFQRCVCGKVGGAKPPLTMMWCECCRGHLVWMWENLLQRPVEVILSESAVTGSPDCVYEVKLK